MLFIISSTLTTPILLTLNRCPKEHSIVLPSDSVTLYISVSSSNGIAITLVGNPSSPNNSSPTLISPHNLGPEGVYTT